MRKPITFKRVLGWIALALAIAAAAVLALGNNVGYSKTLPRRSAPAAAASLRR